MVKELKRISTIRLAKEYMKFSAGHFTVFSATERERLHGHNFSVETDITASVDDNGMCFDYKKIKNKMKILCDQLDEYMLIPSESPFLEVHKESNIYKVIFNDETMQFLCSDTLLLPLCNVTIEELSNYLLTQLTESMSQGELNTLDIIEVRVSTSPGQWASSTWTTEVSERAFS